MDRTNKRFIDEYNNVHESSEELGRGGQGVVFRTKDPDVAVKLALDGEGKPITRQAYVDKLRMVRMLPLPANLNLSTPAAVLQGTAGYAMQLLNDMVSFKYFWPVRQKDVKNDSMAIPDWLNEMPADEAFKIVYYLKTGGLRRRLLALYKCSAILARLHGAGMVYGDMSPANAYISKHLSSSEVWLIDADNLRFETRPRGSGVYTPGFGAPELMQGLDGGRPRTDCHAFAVMAFWMLTLQHPFVGGYVEDGGDADWADDSPEEDLEEKAYAGVVPWIHDEDDDSNATNKGLPSSLMLTEELMTLFQETFGPGRTQFWRRPSIFHWPLALARALDQTLACPECQMTYYYDSADNGQRCPFCDATRLSLLRIVAYDWHGRQEAFGRTIWEWVCELPKALSSPLMLPNRIFAPFSMSDSDRDVLEIIVGSDEVLLRRVESSESLRFAAAVPDKNMCDFVEFVGAMRLPVIACEKGFWLRSNGPQPIMLRFRLEEAAR